MGIGRLSLLEATSFIASLATVALGFVLVGTFGVVCMAYGLVAITIPLQIANLIYTSRSPRISPMRLLLATQAASIVVA
jgi:hypothetical protein